MSYTETWMRCLVASAAVMFAACMDRPRNGEVLPGPDQGFTFSGVVMAPSDTVSLYAKDQSDGSWDHRRTVTAFGASLVYNDSSGSWYPFSTGAGLPYGPSAAGSKYWRVTKDSGQRHLRAQLRAQSASAGNLVTYDVDADACMQAQASGLDVIAYCTSSSSPSAEVLADCGRQDQPCCFGWRVAAGDYCDSGWKCDTNNRCTIQTGGPNQPCNGDGTCSATNLECASGTCLDTAVENAPILTSKLVVHTCDLANAQSGAAKTVRFKSDAQAFFLDHPGNDTARNQNDTWGLAVPKTKRLKDIETLFIALGGSYQQMKDGWCIDRVDLFVNGELLLTKSYPGGTWLDADGPKTFLSVASGGEMRTAILRSNRTAMCSLPTSITFDDLRLKVEATMGHLFQQSTTESPDLSNAGRFDAWWGSGGVSVSELGPGSVLFDMKFRAREEDGFEGTAFVSIEARFGCNWSIDSTQGSCDASNNCSSLITDCTTNFDTGVRVLRIDVDPDTILPFVRDIVEVMAEGALMKELQKQLRSFSSFDGLFGGAEDLVCTKFNLPQLMLCDVNDHLCGCPNVSIDSDSVDFDWTAFGVNQLNLNLVPEPLCQQ